MAMIDLEFPSFNGRDTVAAWASSPIGKARGVIQLLHGFREHSRRYYPLMVRLNEAGYVVCAADNAGHGRTALKNDTRLDAGDKGYMSVVEDLHTLRGLVEKAYPALPFAMLGHSWGSILARCYAAHYGDGMAALLLSGTTARKKEMREIAAALKTRIDEGGGAERDPSLLEKIFVNKSQLARFGRLESPGAWVAVDPAVSADSAADPAVCGGMVPTIQLQYDFLSVILATEGIRWAEKVPAGLPVYNIAGDQDPCGNFGVDPCEVSNWLWETGHRVETKLYAGYRHQLLSEPTIRAEVTDGILGFLERTLSRPIAG